MNFTEPDPLNLLIVLVVGHIATTFWAWVIHFVQHQDFFGIEFSRVHRLAHHDPQFARSNPNAHRWYSVLGHLQWASMIVFWSGLHFMVLPRWVAVTLAVHAALLTAALYYYHAEYVNPKAWLGRFTWFRRMRLMHAIHHKRYPDFARSRNYAIGGPLTGLLIDDLMGTVREPRSLRRRKARRMRGELQRTLVRRRATQ